MSRKKYYVLFIWEDVEPILHGPYGDPDQRDVKALLLRENDPEDCPSGIYPAEVDEDGALHVGTYSGAFFEQLGPEQRGLWDWLAKYPGEEGRP